MDINSRHMAAIELNVKLLEIKTRIVSCTWKQVSILL